MKPTHRRDPNPGRGEDDAARETPAQAAAASSLPENRPAALLPLVAAALDSNAGSALARLRQIAAHSSSRERYTSLELIHDGPGGRVLRVWDEDLQREVALKEVLVDAPKDTDPELGDSEQDERLSRFIDEARITSQLDHPSIVSVHEIAADATGRVYYTMPLVRGATLAQVSQRLHAGDSTWTLPRAILIVATVCEAVAYAHARGVVHQDLKPENVMVGSFGEAIVTDWGLARVLSPDDSDESHQVAGTPAYMAPEVSEQGGSVLGDVYALGATLYAILTNRTPHEATVLSAQGKKPLSDILARSPRNILELAPDAPRELVAVAERAMAKDPKDRYQSAAELARDLRAWLEGRVVTAFESGHLAELRKWHRRNRGLALALHSIAVLCVLSAAVVFWIQAEKGRAVAAKEKEVDQRSYLAEILQADSAIRSGMVREASTALAACEPSLRGWEWNHLDLSVDDSLLAVRPFPDANPTALLRCRDGALVVGSADGSLVKLDGDSFAPQVTRPKAHRGQVGSLCETPDASRILSTSISGELLLWDAATLTLVADIPLDGLRPIMVVAVGAEQAFFVVPEGSLYRLNLRTHGIEQIAEGTNAGAAIALAGSPLRLVAFTGGGTLLSLDPLDPSATPVEVDLRQDVRLLTHLGTDALVVGTWGGNLLVLDPTTLRPLHFGIALQGEQRLQSLTTSPDGSTLLVGTAGGTLLVIKRLDKSLKAIKRLLGHRFGIVASVIHPDTLTFSSISGDGTLRRWNSNHSATRAVRIPSTRGAFAFSDSEERVVGVGTDGIVQSIPLVGNAAPILIPTQGAIPSVALVFGGAVIALSRATGADDQSQVAFFDAASGHSMGTLEPRQTLALELDSSAAGDRLACRGDDGRLRVWSMEPRRLVLDIDDLDGQHVMVKLAQGGGSVAFPIDALTVRVVDVVTGHVQAEASITGLITALAFGQDDQVLWIGDGNRRIHRLDLTGSGTLEFLYREADRVNALAATPDGARLAVATASEVVVRIRDTKTGQLVLSLHGHENPPHALTFSQSGDVLASTSPDGWLHLWYAQP